MWVHSDSAEAIGESFILESVLQQLNKSLFIEMGYHYSSPILPSLTREQAHSQY